MIQRFRRQSLRAKPCKFLFTIEIHDIYFPYEIAQSLGQDAEVCVVFQRGDKFVTTYACKTNQMAHGPMEVTCSEALSLTVTLYKEAESRYMKKTGKLIVQVLTENGWENLGKVRLDLHIIANDLQPIQMSSELEKCVVAGAYVDYTITPKMLNAAEDDQSVTMSDISEITLGSPGSRPNSLTRRFSSAIGFKNINGRQVASVPAHGTNIEQKALERPASINHSSNVEVSGADCNSSVASSHDEVLKREVLEEEKHESNDGLQFPLSNANQNEHDNVDSTVSESPSHINSFKREYEESFAEFERLKNENLRLQAKIEKKRRKNDEAKEKIKSLELQLERKDTEIMAVLNFQKKLESRMTAFVEKEKLLSLKEKELNERNMAGKLEIAGQDVAMDHAVQLIQQREDEIKSLKSKLQDVTSEKEKLEKNLNDLLAAKERFGKMSRNDSLENVGNRTSTPEPKKKPSFRTAIVSESAPHPSTEMKAARYVETAGGNVIVVAAALVIVYFVISLFLKV